MNIEYKNPKIIVIAGYARSGKNTVANILKELYEANNKKVIINSYTKYLKEYIKDITGEYQDGDNKPREFLQQLGVEIIQDKLGKIRLLIDRQLDDIDIYSYFFDTIIIPDARFPKEIDILKERFNNVYSIKVINNHDNNLNNKGKNHITENSLDDYSSNNFDYIINNNNNYEYLYQIVSHIYDNIK